MRTGGEDQISNFREEHGEMSYAKECHGEECSSDHCCQRKPREDEWNCWYHGESGDGWRDPGDASGSNQCPAGTVARSKHDGHRPRNDDDVPHFPENECCRPVDSKWSHSSDNTM